MTLTIYGDLNSGNCLKVKWTAEKLGLAYDWVAVDVVAGGANRTPSGSSTPPPRCRPWCWPTGGPWPSPTPSSCTWPRARADPHATAYQRAKMLEWLFWEQNSHEPAIAVRRRLKFLVGMADADIEARSAGSRRTGAGADAKLAGRLALPGRRQLESGRHRARGLHPHVTPGRLRSRRASRPCRPGSGAWRRSWAWSPFSPA